MKLVFNGMQLNLIKWIQLYFLKQIMLHTRLFLRYYLNYKPIVDPMGKIGRRGFLTLINSTSLESKSVWTVLNSKVICLYNTEDSLSIAKLIRNSMVININFNY